MFWFKKSVPAVPPEVKATPPPLLPPAAAPALSPGFKQELIRELEAENPDTLTVGIGMIKSGQKEMAAGWFDLFIAAEIYAVGVEPDTAFVFGPKEDRNYLALFTRRDLAQKCLQEMPQLKHIMSLAGADWLRLAQTHGRGLWINPLNEACTMQLPAASVGPLLQKMKHPASPWVKAVGGRLPVEPLSMEQPPLPPPQPGSVPAKPVRLAVGPSPWTWRDRSQVVLGRKYRFREYELDGKPTAIIQILNEQDECLLLIGVACYARIMDDGTCLIWWENKVGEGMVLEFRYFALGALQAIADLDTAARALPKGADRVVGLRDSEAFTFGCDVMAGRHAVTAPAGFAKFEETLALGHFLPVNPQPGHQKHAILVFNWPKGEVEVIPQDWFNKGKYDFEYMWIARVARLADGKIVGDGVRLGRFELDATGRQIGRWLEENPGYMLS